MMSVTVRGPLAKRLQLLADLHVFPVPRQRSTHLFGRVDRIDGRNVLVAVLPVFHAGVPVGLFRPAALGGDLQGLAHPHGAARMVRIQVAGDHVHRLAAGKLAALHQVHAGQGDVVIDVIARADRPVPLPGLAGDVLSRAGEQVPELFLALGGEFRRVVDAGNGEIGGRPDLAAPAGVPAVFRVVPERVVIAQAEGEMRDAGRRRPRIVTLDVVGLGNAHLGTGSFDLGLGNGYPVFGRLRGRGFFTHASVSASRCRAAAPGPARR